MEHLSRPALSPTAQPDGASHIGPLIIVTVLFFMWGLLTSLNDVLIPHLKAIYTLSYVQAMLVQFCFFGAYAIVSLPAGLLIKRIGYQSGAVVGLTIAAAGCALFFPASNSGYAVFLLAFFVLAAGITILQVAANPYVTVLGDAATASSRLTLTQAFNSLGTTIAPTLGGMLILAGGVLTAADIARLPAPDQVAYRAHQAASVQGPYLALASALLALALLFAIARLPKISHANASERAGGGRGIRVRTPPSGARCGWYFPVRGRRGQHRQLPDQLSRRRQDRRPDPGCGRALRQLLLGWSDAWALHRLWRDARR